MGHARRRAAGPAGRADFLLGGQVAPTSPAARLAAADVLVLPFRYMVAFPVEVLTGQVRGPDLWVGFGAQAAWLAVALVAFVALWRSGVRRYSAVGG